MSMSGWKRIFFADDGALRSVWRLLLFAVLFVGLIGMGVLLLPLLPRGVSPLFWEGLLMLGAALGAGAVLIIAADDRPPGALGLAWTRQVPRELWAGFLIGGGALAAAVGVMAAAGWITFRPAEGTVSLLATVLFADLLVLAVRAAAEEALFRGYPFQVLVQWIGPIAATLIASAAFAVAHAANPNVGTLGLINIFLAGVLLSVAYLRTRSLWFATAVHLGWNWTMASVFHLPVSGFDDFATPLYEAAVTGPEWVTGGAFGPEGGVAASIALALATLAIFVLPGIGEVDEMRSRRPLPDTRMNMLGGTR